MDICQRRHLLYECRFELYDPKRYLPVEQLKLMDVFVVARRSMFWISGGPHPDQDGDVSCCSHDENGQYWGFEPNSYTWVDDATVALDGF